MNEKQLKEWFDNLHSIPEVKNPEVKLITWETVRNLLLPGIEETVEKEQETYDFQDGNGPVPAHKHPNGGGWVANTAQVDDTAFVGEDAKVYDDAWVSGKAKVFGNAEVYGNAMVFGNAEVYGDAKVSGNAEVFSGSFR